MRRKLLILSLITALFCIGSVNVQAAPKDDPAAKLPFKKKLKWADALYKQASFYTAVDYYYQLKKEQPRNPYVTYMLAECSWMMRDYPPAAEYYAEAFALAPELYKEAPYKEGLMRKQNGEYEKAIERFTYYKVNYKGKNKKMKVYAQRHIEGCQMAIKSLDDPGRAFVKNAGPNVNTAYTELSPMPLGDTALLFATMDQNKIIDPKDTKRKDWVSRFMWAPKEFDRTRIKDSFEVKMKFEDGKYNDQKYHVGNGSWSPGGSRFYFTKCKEDSLSTKCKIYVTSFDKKVIWGTPKEMDEFINDPESNNTQPYCTMIGKKEVLYFVSNRKLQSAGGYDIWYTVYDSARKTYRRPQNCGKKINSYADDMTPYFDSRKNKIYFSSNGWPSLGGFDIFSADANSPSRYSNLTNLGFPINSSADDMYYVQDPGKKDNAYVVSNRLGSYFVKNPTCCDDIWRIIKEPNFYVKGIVLDEVTNQQIDKVVVKMKDEATGNLKDTAFSKEGNFLFYTPMGKNYSITADKKEYISGRTIVSTTGKSTMDPDDTTMVTIYMRKITKDFEFHVNNVYYNFDKGEFQPDSYAALDSMVRFLTDNPSLSVEIRSYTDSKGLESYNDELSVKRAQAVMSYMGSKGIDRGRMIARGEGMKNPIKPNKINGQDNPTGRQYNRRTEFRIIGELPDLRIIYDQNKPEYIDKSGNEGRNKNLQINNDENEEGGAPDPEVNPGNRVGGQ
ncbi:MAG: OmpA family protein [Bacteroidetes bacterium]|nr:OmpA family protein [Bacteroidota bacterium]